MSKHKIVKELTDDEMDEWLKTRGYTKYQRFFQKIKSWRRKVKFNREFKKIKIWDENSW